jgi:hypothetical protein
MASTVSRDEEAGRSSTTQLLVGSFYPKGQPVSKKKTSYGSTRVSHFSKEVTDEETRGANIPLLTSAYLATLTTGGTTYAFGLYGAALKKSLQLSQSQLDTVSSANFCAGLLSWIPGLIVDRCGPRFALSFGGILGASSLISYWLVAREFIQIDRIMIVPTLSLLGVLIFASSALVTGSVFKIIVGTCGPGSKGSAVGAAKGYVGLGAGAYSCLFQSLRVHSTSDLDFLPMSAFFCIVAVTIPALLLLPSKNDIQLHPTIDRMSPLHLRLLYSGLVGLAIMVVGTSVSELNSQHESPENDDGELRTRGGPHYASALLILTVWLGPIVGLLFVPTAKEEEEEEEEVSEEYQDRAQDISTESEKDDKNLFEMLQTATAWLFAWTTMILVGGGIIMTNNMGQMVEAMHFSPVTTPASLALFSVAQAGARVITGAASEWALSHNIARPSFLILGSLAGVASHSLLAVATSEGPFVVGVALSGAAFGMVWPLMVLIIGEVFGTAHVGANYLFYDGFSSAMGTLLLSKFVAQTVYEAHIDHNDEHSDGFTCYGQDCFRGSHMIVAGLSLSCVLSSVGVLHATRKSYANKAVTYDPVSVVEEGNCDRTL